MIYTKITFNIYVGKNTIKNNRNCIFVSFSYNVMGGNSINSLNTFEYTCKRQRTHDKINSLDKLRQRNYSEYIFSVIDKKA
jgi:hypothetical protein